MLFHSVDGPEKIAFVKDSAGRLVGYLDFPFIVVQEVNATLDKQMLNYVVIGCAGGVIVLTILLWPVAAMLRKHYGKPLTLNEGARKWRRWAKIACIIDIIYLPSAASDRSAGRSRGLAYDHCCDPVVGR